MGTGTPRIVTTLREAPGPYRRHVAPAGEPVAAARALPEIPGGLVRISVEDGLRPGQATMLLAAADRLRSASVVEIHGRTRKAVKDAEAMLLAAWSIDDVLRGRDGCPG
ncbi:hypothetical protein [Kitasatospora sp. NBC_01302]|uniref:hypothetical protein n=1 Tax=Kitasatospora sp. NBC_01302 TaxID=2903575 RepID=UPI002E13A774|nr:hypothetical protein OG294_27770 [Kitasatospora sp. NBC_01302]